MAKKKKLPSYIHFFLTNRERMICLKSPKIHIMCLLDFLYWVLGYHDSLWCCIWGGFTRLRNIPLGNKGYCPDSRSRIHCGNASILSQQWWICSQLSVMIIWRLSNAMTQYGLIWLCTAQKSSAVLLYYKGAYKQRWVECSICSCCLKFGSSCFPRTFISTSLSSKVRI